MHHETKRINSLPKRQRAAFSAGPFTARVVSQRRCRFWCGRVVRNDGGSGVWIGDPYAGGHHPATAKSVIFLFMEGGPSQLDTFDRKPLVNELAGKPLPAGFKEPITAMGEKNSPILASKRTWARYGESGLEISDWLPNIAQHADDLAVIRSCYGEGINHSGGCNLMNTCSILGGRPSLGAWISYGLGTENQDLPAFVVMTDKNASSVTNGVRSWGPGFLPATYQGTPVGDPSSKQPIANLIPPPGVDDAKTVEETGVDSQDQRSSRLSTAECFAAGCPDSVVRVGVSHAKFGARSC